MHGATSFDALAAFARVAECRSFSEAARQLGVTPSALSHSLRQLEATLNLRLLHRTTRSVSPTEAGQMLLDRLTPALQDMRQTLHDVQSMGESPSGKLRLNVPRHTARMVLAPVLGAFHARCPNVELEIVTEDRMVDIVRDGFDAGIRFGERLANDMVAMPIRPVPRFLVVGTPGYFEKHGVPKTPEDLKSHLCINRRFSSGARYAWEFEKKGRALEVQVQGPLALDDDIVIIKKTDRAADGKIIVALVDGQEVTLKRLRREAGKVILEPENDAYKPRVLTADRVQIQGELSSLIRSYH